MRFLEIATSGTFVIKVVPGHLHHIVVNAAGTTWTLQIFDQTSAAVPAIAGASAFTIPAAGSVLNYEVDFSNGLTIVTAGATPGSITVGYY